VDLAQGKLVDVDAPQNCEVSELPDLFRLEIRVRWLYQPITKWRFRPPQPASLIRVGGTKTRTVPQAHTVAAQPTLGPIEKFTLIKESDEACYWCARTIGSKVTIRGRTRRLKLHWDHVTPEHAGGASDITNMVPSCHLCNAWKAGNVFPTEDAIRYFLEERWTIELSAPIAEKPSPTVPVVEAEPVSIVPVVAPPPRGKQSIAPLIAEPELQTASPGPFNKPRHQWKYGDEIRIVTGVVQGAAGTVAGPSKEREGWIRVMLGPQSVPWRFLPEQLARL